jgi:F-box protein 9
MLNALSALKAYRAAMRLDPDVETEYYRSTYHTTQQSTTEGYIQLGNDYEVKQKETRNDDVTLLLYQDLRTEYLTFLPEDSEQGLLLETIPSDAVVCILKQLGQIDIKGVERFGQVCKKGFVLSRSEDLWKFLCQQVFQRQGIGQEEGALYLEKHSCAWRDVYIEYPRIRMDGVYICICTYMRETSEMAWSSNIQIVTYYRYLRFFPDMSCLSLVTSEEPVKIVKAMNLDMEQRKGLMRGTYATVANDVRLTLTDHLRPAKNFGILLTKKSSQRGKHNKLIWRHYFCTDLVSDDAEPLDFDISSFKNFVFSKVRSFAP